MDANLTLEQPLEMTISAEIGEEDDGLERVNFWDSENTIRWFSARGYTLYKRIDSDVTIYSTRPASITEDLLGEHYPYAFHDVKDWEGCTVPLRALERTGRVLFAQDSQQRHVAIKLVRADSQEYNILRFLSQQSLATLEENCIIPVLDFLPAVGFWLVVMPRWGVEIHVPWRNTYRDNLQIMHSVLKALAFLHEHNITHRDIKIENMLVNYFGDDDRMLDNSLRVDLRSQGRLSYAIFDFDISIMVPAEIKKEDYRLPYQLSWWGPYNLPRDTAQGEFDYNPFRYDVGTLGVEFCNYYQVLTKYIPMLAPLLDRMTTRDLQSRFTAAEALQFFEARYAELPQSLLETAHEAFRHRHSDVFDRYDRWADHLCLQSSQRNGRHIGNRRFLSPRRSCVPSSSLDGSLSTRFREFLGSFMFCQRRCTVSGRASLDWAL